MNFLLEAYNVPFLFALGGCVVFALLQIVGGFGDADGDMDIDADADIDFSGDFMDDMLSILGVGRVPMMLIIMTFLGTFGLIGLLLNTINRQTIANFSALSISGALLGSLLLAFFITGRISRGIAKLIPDNSAAVSFEQLVGRIGTVSSPSVSTTYGRVQVRDIHGTNHTVYAMLAAGEPIPERSEVALLSYDTARRCYIVKPIS
jgi:hypothetical protein